MNKEESRRRWCELRAIVGEWDPIGVMSDPEWPRDEYDCLLGPMLRLLENGATESEIATYLRGEIKNHFGLEPHDPAISEVARRIRVWFVPFQPKPE